MKLSAPKWLALFGALTSRDSSQLNERQETTTSMKMFPAPLGIFTLPPGPQTLVISEDTLHVVEVFPSTTITTTWVSTAWSLTTEGPIIYYPAASYFPGASLYIVGDSSLLVTATATAATTESILTSTTCSSSICSPTPTAVDYTCEVSNGVTQPVTTVMQSFSCTTGQVCEGVPVKTTLDCDCGGPICTTVLPLIPIPPIVIPVGAPIPPAVPGPPDVPDGVPDPEITITEDPTVSEPPTSTSDENSDEPTSTSSDLTSSDTSSTSSSTTSSTSSISGSSSTTSGSNSTASACSLGGFTIATDFESTLSAWIDQFPFTIPATFRSNSTNTVSKSLISSSSTSLISSSTVNTPNPTPTPSQTPTSGPKSTSLTCDSACLSSSVSASSAFEASLSASMVAGHSSFTQSLSGALASQSASISSAQQAQSEISKCQHYTLSYPWNPPDLPVTLATYNGNSNGGRWMCVIYPTQIDTGADWNATWDYQPFGIDKSWDRDHPKDTLIDTFCNYLVNEKVNVTPLGDVQGVCQAYDLGQCLNPTRAGLCTYWQHPWTTLDTWGPVMISVAYDRVCPVDKNAKPVNFGAVGAADCKKSLNALVNNCSFPKNKQKGWAGDDPTVGGTIWSNCMIYTIIGIKENNKPAIIWQH